MQGKRPGDNSSDDEMVVQQEYLSLYFHYTALLNCPQLKIRQDGWYLLSDIIWNKPNAMPESVKDRPTRSHEYLFLLSKFEKYYYDHESVMEMNGRGRRNRRTVWDICTQPFPESHFATFPPELVDPCILAGSRTGDYVLDPFFGSGTVGIVCQRAGLAHMALDGKSQFKAIMQYLQG